MLGLLMNRHDLRAGVAALLGTAGLLALAACDGGSATPARDHSASVGAPTGASYSSGGGAAPADRSGGADSYRDDPRREPVRLVHGKPMWAANRRHSADDNAQYQFDRDGADFGAKSVDDFVAKVHAFVDHPPADAQTLVRNNGDKLIYEAKDNVFAVVTKDGAPRTMFKPRDGAAYWDQQKERVAEQSKDGGGSSSDGGNRRRYRARNGDGGQDDQG
jgi:pyocin large subunit-like protein